MTESTDDLRELCEVAIDNNLTGEQMEIIGRALKARLDAKPADAETESLILRVHYVFKQHCGDSEAHEVTKKLRKITRAKPAAVPEVVVRAIRRARTAMSMWQNGYAFDEHGAARQIQEEIDAADAMLAAAPEPKPMTNTTFDVGQDLPLACCPDDVRLLVATAPEAQPAAVELDLSNPSKIFSAGITNGLMRATFILRNEFKHQEALRELYAARLEREAKKISTEAEAQPVPAPKDDGGRER